MITFIFHSIFLSACFYFIFRWLLESKKCFGFNRIYLILVSIFSLILPLLSGLSWSPEHHLLPLSELSYQLPQFETNSIPLSKHIDLNFWLKFFYAIGCLWGFTRLIMGFFVLYRIRQSAETLRHASYSVFKHAALKSPFSFFNAIYLPQISKGDQDAILIHEAMHLRNYHSIDKIVMIVLQSILWFNPFIYRIHKSLELQHEFQADEQTITSIPRDSYIEVLLQHPQTNSVPALIVHSFYTHPLKTRIIMIYQNSKASGYAKALASLSVILITGFSLLAQQKTSTNSNVLNRPSSSNYGDTIQVKGPNGAKNVAITTTDAGQNPSELSTFASFPGGNQALMQHLMDNLIYPTEDQKNKREGKVIIGFIVDETGAIREPKVLSSTGTKAMEKEALRVVSEMPAFIPGKNKGKISASTLQLPIVFKLS